MHVYGNYHRASGRHTRGTDAVIFSVIGGVLVRAARQCFRSYSAQPTLNFLLFVGLLGR
jgi:hypothetical protein